MSGHGEHHGASLVDLIKLQEMYEHLFSGDLDKAKIDKTVEDIRKKADENPTEFYNHQLAFLLAKDKHKDNYMAGLEKKISGEVEKDWEAKMEIVSEFQKSFSGASKSSPAKGSDRAFERYLGQMIVLATQGVDQYKTLSKQADDSIRENFWETYVTGFISTYSSAIIEQLAKAGVKTEDIQTPQDIMKKLVGLIKTGQITDKTGNNLWQVLTNTLRSDIAGTDKQIVKNLLGKDNAQILGLKKHIAYAHEIGEFYKDFEYDEANIQDADVGAMIGAYMKRDFGNIYETVKKGKKTTVDTTDLKKTYS